MSEAQQLLRLQAIDSEIMQKKQRLGEVLALLKASDEVLGARQRAENAGAELRSWQAQQKDLTLELETLINKAKRSESRLYSGKITNAKELADLQKEVASLGRRREALEDRILEAMIMVEEAEAEAASAEAALSAVEAAWKRSQSELAAEQNELVLRLNELADARRKQLSLIPTAALKDYTVISKRRGGLAVVVLQDNLCQGCQLNVSANTVKAVKQGEVVHCENCDRILTQQW